MDLREALQHLGATRVIWIDDHFNSTPEQVGRMLANNLEATKTCDFPEFREVIDRQEFDSENTAGTIAQILADRTKPRQEETNLTKSHFLRLGQIADCPVRCDDTRLCS
jgi:hypothetical protein